MASIARTAVGRCCSSCSASVVRSKAGKQCRGLQVRGVACIQQRPQLRTIVSSCFRFVGDVRLSSGWTGFHSPTSSGSSSFHVFSISARAYHPESDFPYARSSSSGAHDQLGQAEEKDEFPRPSLIIWDMNLVNSVQLIGNVGKELDIKYLDTAKVVARSSLAVRKYTLPRKEEQAVDWFDIEFWDTLAEIAAHHVKKGDRIFVSGRLKIDTFLRNEVPQTKVKVVVKELHFVDREIIDYGKRVAQNEEFVEEATLNRPQEGPRVAGDKLPASQQRSAKQSPDLPSATSGTKQYPEASLATEKMWQEFFTDPTQWWDNRGLKKNPKSPDFKHKSTKEALWVESWNNPPWVQQQLYVWENTKSTHVKESGYGSKHSNNKSLSSFEDSDFTFYQNSR